MSHETWVFVWMVLGLWAAMCALLGLCWHLYLNRCKALAAIKGVEL